MNNVKLTVFKNGGNVFYSNSYDLEGNDETIKQTVNIMRNFADDLIEKLTGKEVQPSLRGFAGYVVIDEYITYSYLIEVNDE